MVRKIPYTVALPGLMMGNVEHSSDSDNSKRYVGQFAE